MIVVQETLVPTGSATPLIDLIAGLRAIWRELHPSHAGGRILVPFSGLPRQVIWQHECSSFGVYEGLRLALEAHAGARTLLDRVANSVTDADNRFYSVVGHDDAAAQVRGDGIVVQARYVPRHGHRQRALDLLREWQRDWASVYEPEMKGRVLGFTSTGVTHDILWQAEYPSAAAYEAAYSRWSASDAFDAWAREFRDAYTTNTHAILRIVA